MDPVNIDGQVVSILWDHETCRSDRLSGEIVDRILHVAKPYGVVKSFRVYVCIQPHELSQEASDYYNLLRGYGIATTYCPGDTYESTILTDLILQAWSSSVVVLVSADSKLAPAVSLLGSHDRHVVTISPFTHLFKIGTRKTLSWKYDILCVDGEQDVPAEPNRPSHLKPSTEAVTKGGTSSVTISTRISHLGESVAGSRTLEYQGERSTAIESSISNSNTLCNCLPGLSEGHRVEKLHTSNPELLSGNSSLETPSSESTLSYFGSENDAEPVQHHDTLLDAYNAIPSLTQARLTFEHAMVALHDQNALTSTPSSSLAPSILDSPVVSVSDAMKTGDLVVGGELESVSAPLPAGYYTSEFSGERILECSNLDVLSVIPEFNTSPGISNKCIDTGLSSPRSYRDSPQLTVLTVASSSNAFGPLSSYSSNDENDEEHPAVLKPESVRKHSFYSLTGNSVTVLPSTSFGKESEYYVTECISPRSPVTPFCAVATTGSLRSEVCSDQEEKSGFHSRDEIYSPHRLHVLESMRSTLTGDGEQPIPSLGTLCSPSGSPYPMNWSSSLRNRVPFPQQELDAGDLLPLLQTVGSCDEGPSVISAGRWPTLQHYMGSPGQCDYELSPSLSAKQSINCGHPYQEQVDDDRSSLNHSMIAPSSIGTCTPQSYRSGYAMSPLVETNKFPNNHSPGHELSSSPLTCTAHCSELGEDLHNDQEFSPFPEPSSNELPTIHTDDLQSTFIYRSHRHSLMNSPQASFSCEQLSLNDNDAAQHHTAIDLDCHFNVSPTHSCGAIHSVDTSHHALTLSLTSDEVLPEPELGLTSPVLVSSVEEVGSPIHDLSPMSLSVPPQSSYIVSQMVNDHAPSTTSPKATEYQQLYIESVKPLSIPSKPCTRISVPARFTRLVDILVQLRDEGQIRPNWSCVASPLLKEDPTVYSRAGVTSFKGFIELAVDAKLVNIGPLNSPYEHYVSLQEDIYSIRSQIRASGPAKTSSHPADTGSLNAIASALRTDRDRGSTAILASSHAAVTQTDIQVNLAPPRFFCDSRFTSLVARIGQIGKGSPKRCTWSELGSHMQKDYGEARTLKQFLLLAQQSLAQAIRVDVKDQWVELREDVVVHAFDDEKMLCVPKNFIPLVQVLFKEGARPNFRLSEKNLRLRKAITEMGTMIGQEQARTANDALQVAGKLGLITRRPNDWVELVPGVVYYGI